MYLPKPYQEHDRETILAFLRENNFAIFVTHDGERPIATHAPTEVVENEDGTLTVYTHMSRANPQWKMLNGQECLIIFPGAHTYISPRWYNHVNVPTWNYTMIHVYGKPAVMEDDEFRGLLSRLIQHHESDHEEYRLESLPPEFVEKEMRGAVGIQMEVTRIDAGFKLSQNRNAEAYQNIIAELQKRPDEMSHGVGNAMKEKRPL
mgnify:CR=1 FL=1